MIVADYGVLIPEKLLADRLWLNVHPSLLPRWRGAAPVERAIMAGDRETGVTIHRTTAELDAGPIAAQRRFPIGPDDDAGGRLRAGDPRRARAAGRGASPSRRSSRSPRSGSTYAEKITAADRELDWSLPPEENLNRIRALSPHIGARGLVEGRRLIVWRARPARPEAALVAGGIEPLEVQREGGRRMTAEEYLRGLRK